MGGKVSIVVQGKSIRPAPISKRDFSRVREEMSRLMMGVNYAFSKKYGKNLWVDRPAFAGSTRILMSDDEHGTLEKIDSIGDLDVMIDKSDAIDLWDVLRGHHLESINSRSSMKIIGTPATSPRRSGYNLLVDLDGTIMQLDVFATRTPHESSLGHFLSSEDVEMNIKGLFKNKLINEVCRVTTRLPGVLLKKHVDLAEEIQFHLLQKDPNRINFSPDCGYRRRILFDINLEGIDLYLQTPLPVREEDVIDEDAGTQEAFGIRTKPEDISSFAGCCRAIRKMPADTIAAIFSGLQLTLSEESHRIGEDQIQRSVRIFKDIVNL